MINWSNQKKHLCVCCSKPLTDSSFWNCLKCGKACNPIPKEEISEIDKTYKVYDVKSECCNADVKNMQQSTCSKKCHEDLCNELERMFGEYKQIVDAETGFTHRVPTRVIIEKGLNQHDLKDYPVIKK